MDIDLALEKLVTLLLWRCQAIEVRDQDPFQLTSGNFTPLYINCRRLISHPAARDVILSGAHYLCCERDMNADGVAGGETAGIPFGAWLAERLDKPFLYVRKKRKGHGIGTLVEGIASGRILLFEDLITDGGSKVGFVEALRGVGGMVSDCLVVVDREEGGVATLEKLGVKLHALTRVSACLQSGLESGLISEAALASAREYLADPRGWHQSRGLGFTSPRNASHNPAV